MNAAQVRQELQKNHIDDLTVARATEILEGLHAFDGLEEFRALTAGMTNRLFYLRGKEGAKLLRIPGEGSEMLVDRTLEERVYKDLAGLHITDRVFYINASNGIKVTEYIEEAHSCDPENREDVTKSMQHLRAFHAHALTGYPAFNLREKIALYESEIAHDVTQVLPDYPGVKKKVLNALDRIEELPAQQILCHIDAVHDNFIINNDKLRLIDWEYAAQADPHMDVAMFCIYAGYDDTKADAAIDAYFGETPCDALTREKIHTYMGVCAFLWTLWCEIKRDKGVLFETYESRQYAYARQLLEE